MMEKLTVEITLAAEEMTVFNEFIDLFCIDREKFLKRELEKAVQKASKSVEKLKLRKNLAETNRNGGAPKPSRKEGQSS